MARRKTTEQLAADAAIAAMQGKPARVKKTEADDPNKVHARSDKIGLTICGGIVTGAVKLADVRSQINCRGCNRDLQLAIARALAAPRVAGEGT